MIRLNLNLLIYFMISISMSDSDYFELKYLEEIHELFLSLKQKSELFNLGLFQKNDNFMDLFDFLFDSIEMNNEEDSEGEDNTLNDEEYYSMLK